MTNVDDASLGKANGLFGLQFLSDFGDQITNALLALCVLDITQSTGKVGFIYVVTTFGFVVFTLVGGLLGDALSRRNILCFADLGRGLAVLLLLLAVREKSISLIYATSFLLSILGSIHGPVKVSTWAENIPASYLERYNSLFELSLQISTILGPLIASFFILRNWTNFGFAMDALSFFICAIVFSQIVANKTKARKQTPKRDFLKGFKIIAEESEIKKYVSYDAIQMIGFGAFNATFLVLAQRDFGWSKVDYSYHLTIVALFTTVGALMGATRMAAKIDPVAKLTVCALISAMALYATLKVQSFPQSSFLLGICDGLIVLTMAVARTKVQLRAMQFYPDYLSSILASRSIIIKAATLFGAGACLLIEDFMSLENTLTLFVVPIGLSVLPFFRDSRKALPLEDVGPINTAD
jgi:MFS family permease